VPASTTGASTRHFVFPTTVAAEATLISQITELLDPYFDKPVDLRPLLQKILVEAAVKELPDGGRVLYNAAHAIFFHLPGDTGHGGIRFATLEDVAAILGKKLGANSVLAAYTQGFENFAQLSELMADADSAGVLEVVWATTPRSLEHKEFIQYLLLRPLQQAAEIRDETPACREEINRFIDEVRVGKRVAVPELPGVSNTVRPTRFVRHKEKIFLVLSESLIARYYVIAQLSVSGRSCTVVGETPLFVM
jgi:hypothetical protein